MNIYSTIFRVLVLALKRKYWPHRLQLLLLLNKLGFLQMKSSLSVGHWFSVKFSSGVYTHLCHIPWSFWCSQCSQSCIAPSASPTGNDAEAQPLWTLCHWYALMWFTWFHFLTASQLQWCSSTAGTQLHLVRRGLTRSEFPIPPPSSHSVNQSSVDLGPGLSCSTSEPLLRFFASLGYVSASIFSSVTL